MGTDIHFVIEKRAVKGAPYQWIGVFSTDEDITYLGHEGREHSPLWAFKERDYLFFARLAGVRGAGPGPRGWPPDASQLALDEFERRGDHTQSWATLREFVMANRLSEAEHHELDAEMNPDKVTADGTPHPESYAALAAARLNGTDIVMEQLRVPYLALSQIDNYRVLYWFDS